MFDNRNSYTLRTETSEEITKYYVTFKDGYGVRHESEVSHAVFQEFLLFIKLERNLRRWEERHIEQSELSDETLYFRALRKPRSIEDMAIENQRNERLKLAIQQLPKIQRRRFVLYHKHGLTYEEIAGIERCSIVSAFKSVTRAEEKTKENLKYFYL